MADRGEPLFECCGATGRTMLRNFIDSECFNVDSALTDNLRALISAHPDIEHLLTFLGGVYVVDLPPLESAIRLSGPCQECKMTASVILIEAQLLQTLRQLLLIFAETIVVWKVEGDGRLTIEHGQPGARQIDEFRELLAEFQGDKEPNPERFSMFIERWNALSPEIAAAFAATADLAWLWFVAHEAAHAFDLALPDEPPELAFPRPHYHQINATIAKDVVSHVADGAVANRYVRELTADTIAVDILWNGIMPKFVEKNSVELSGVIAAAEIAAAIALVCETFFRAEQATFLRESDHSDRFPDHPSGSSRHQVMMSYLSHLCGSIDASAFDYLAGIIARATRDLSRAT